MSAHPPNEGEWWFDGRDLLLKQDGVWRAMLSPHNRDWHAFSEADCRRVALLGEALRDACAAALALIRREEEEFEAWAEVARTQIMGTTPLAADG